MTHGITISKEGKEAGSTDPLDLVLSSEYEPTIIVKSGDFATPLVLSGDTYIVTIAHGLGYPPLFKAYWGGYASGSGPLSEITLQTYDTISYSDDTNLYISFYNSLGSDNYYEGKYYVFL